MGSTHTKARKDEIVADLGPAISVEQTFDPLGRIAEAIASILAA